MIRVESDTGGDWDSHIDWPAIADRAAQAAVARSGSAGLAEGPLTIELSVKFTGDAEVRALNAAYRNRDKATNVLSFPMLEPADIAKLSPEKSGELLLGDIVLAHGICASEAGERGIAVADHAAHLVVHGVLHLLGYDHETGEEDAEAMEKIERESLASIGIADPYLTEVRS
jgi:probable rRNA maturation factor